MRAYFAIKHIYPDIHPIDVTKTILGHSEAIQEHFGFHADEMIEYMRGFFEKQLVQNAPLRTALDHLEQFGPDDFPEDLLLGDRQAALATVCRILGDLADDGVFYLSARTAGDFLHTSHTSAAMYIRGLCERGMIKKTEEHKRGSHKAQRYTFEYNFTEYTEITE
jgi:hypothetical protein